MKVDNREKIVVDKAVEAVVFFDLFDFPLSLWEIYSEIGCQHSFRDLRLWLNQDKRLEEKNGFFFLPGRSEILSIRQQRHNYARRKYKIALRFARLFSLFPWVKSVALANVMGYNNLRDGSDIDFFIITSAGRLWLSRLYCTGLAKLLGRRPTATNKRDRLCLSFYLSRENMDIRYLSLAGNDPYFNRWHRHLILLYNKDDTFNQFLEANDKQSVGVFTPPIVSLDIWERMAKIWQLKIMPSELKAAALKSDGVVINDSVLKFYQRDRRREFAYKYEEKIKIIV